MKIQDSLLYVGLSDCSINVWDLLTLQLIRSFQFGDNNFDEILSLDIYDNCIYKGSSSTGLIKLSILNHQFISDKILMSLEIEDGVINAVKIFPWMMIKFIYFLVPVNHYLYGISRQVNLLRINVMIKI